MESIFKKTIISICIANFCALNLYMILLVYRNPSFSFISIANQISSYLEMALIFFTFGLLIALFFSVIIGWPLYWLADKFKVKNYVTSAFVGFAVATAPLIILKYFGWNLPSFFSEVGITIVSALGACGTIGGITFWWLSSSQTKGSLAT